MTAVMTLFTQPSHHYARLPSHHVFMGPVDPTLLGFDGVTMLRGAPFLE